MKKQAFNPYLPSYEYIPDGEPRVFGDRLYVYGSHDRFDGTDYCQNNYVCWSTHVDDLSDWKFEGEIYNKNQDPNKQGDWNLYAPDVTIGPDGRYYLYYSAANTSIISVAVCDTPAGKFEYYGDVVDKSGHVMGSSKGDYFQFDPSIFIDDDGKIYLYSGQSNLIVKKLYGRRIVGAYVMELEQDMKTVKNGPTIVIPRKPNKGFKGNSFSEGASMRKINGLYYLVYSPFPKGRRLCYAVSRYPDRDFEYGGVIHDNTGSGYGGDTNKYYPGGNNHGGIVCIKGQYYIFGHRHTNATAYSRQGIAEPITIEEDGTIKQVEMTSCGLNGAPLKGEGEYPAYIACCLLGKKGLPKFFAKKTKPFPYMTQDGEDREDNPNQHIAHMLDGASAGFKYFQFETVNCITVKTRGSAKGRLIFSHTLHGTPVGTVEVSPSTDWHEFSGDVHITEGKKALYFTFEGTGELAVMSFSLQK